MPYILSRSLDTKFSKIANWAGQYSLAPAHNDRPLY